MTFDNPTGIIIFSSSLMLVFVFMWDKKARRVKELKEEIKYLKYHRQGKNSQPSIHHSLAISK